MPAAPRRTSRLSWSELCHALLGQMICLSCGVVVIARRRCGFAPGRSPNRSTARLEDERQVLTRPSTYVPCPCPSAWRSSCLLVWWPHWATPARAGGDRTQANKAKMISFAAYAALVDLFPPSPSRTPSRARLPARDWGRSTCGSHAPGPVLARPTQRRILFRNPTSSPWRSAPRCILAAGSPPPSWLSPPS